MTAFGVVKIIFSNEMYVPSPRNEKSDAEKNQTRNLMTSEDPLEMIKQYEMIKIDLIDESEKDNLPNKTFTWNIASYNGREMDV